MEDKEQKTSSKMEPLPPSQNRGFLTSNAPAYNLLDHPEFYMLGKMILDTYTNFYLEMCQWTYYKCYYIINK